VTIPGKWGNKVLADLLPGMNVVEHPVNECIQVAIDLLVIACEDV
jgi:hypothetical protein